MGTRRRTAPRGIRLGLAVLLIAARPALLRADPRGPAPDTPQDMCDLADCYYAGDGVAQSYQRALYWYHKAANLGSPAL